MPCFANKTYWKCVAQLGRDRGAADSKDHVSRGRVAPWTKHKEKPKERR